ncbi:MAG: choloylglycine hydrolase [Huintestinicola sp.]
MCTGIAMKADDFYFGRNMDLGYYFGEQVVIAPRNYAFEFRKAGQMKSHYAIIGMASVADNYPLYAEAANEKGLCIAGLNFPGNAYYSPELSDSKTNVSPFELIPYILGQCTTVDEAVELLEKTHVTAIPFSDALPLATLHWLISDKNRSVTLEVMKNGMNIHDNPVNVLTNNPPFDFHMTNLAQYMNLTPTLTPNKFGKSGIGEFGKGLGSFGLPGDYSPASRFVKTAFMLAYAECGSGEDECISKFFHILDSVAVVNGTIPSDTDMGYFTTYSCCINADKGIYYYKTYSDNRLNAVDMHRAELDSDKLFCYPALRRQDVNFQN